MAADIMLGDDDNPTVTLVGDTVRFAGASSTHVTLRGGILVQDEILVRIPVAAPLPVGNAFGTVSIAHGLGGAVSRAASSLGSSGYVTAVASIGGSVWDALAEPREYVDLVKEVKRLRAAVFDLNNRLKAMGG